MNKFFVISLSVLLAIGIILRLSHLDISKRTPDEKIYVYQADRIANDGMEGTRQLIHEENLDPTQWEYPPPTRIGYDYTLAGVIKLIKIPDERSGTYLSIFASIGSLVLLLIIGLRFFTPWITLIAMMGMITSPMDLAIARRCWQDSLFGFVWLFFIYICAEIIKSPQKKILYLPLLLTGIYGLLIKEIGIVIFALGILGLLFHEIFKKKSIAGSVIVMIIGLLGMATSFILLLIVCGQFSEIKELYQHLTKSIPYNEYDLQYQTGPWYQILELFWILTPLFTLFTLLGCGITLLYNRVKSFSSLGLIHNISIARGIVLFSILFNVFIMLLPYNQNLRYLSVTFVPFYLLSGWSLWNMIVFFQNRLGSFASKIMTTILFLIIIGFAFYQYQTFISLFVKKALADLNIGFLRGRIYIPLNSNIL
ncbi:MAG: hypothetical protein HQL15_04780 [Candidatus Omnitrophica bacterium]|nr:hypothetical protein [Candidatus Omnitrophota bacterium]